MVNIVVLLVPVALVCSARAHENPNESACRALVECLSAVEDARAQCDKQKQPNGKNGRKRHAPANGDCSSIGAKNEELQQLYAQQKQEHLACLEKRYTLAVQVGDKRKQEQCDKAVSEYQLHSAGNASSGAISRKYKQADLNATDGPSAANSTDPINSNSSSNATLIADSPITNQTEGRNASNGDKATGSTQSKQCYHDAEEKQKQCRNLIGCCSEVGPCDDQFHLDIGSDLHKRIYQARAELDEMRRRCSKQTKGEEGRGQAGNSTAPADQVKRENIVKKPKGIN